MLHDTSRDCAADDLYPDKMTDADARRIRGIRIRDETARFYASWSARMRVALRNSPITGRRVDIR